MNYRRSIALIILFFLIISAFLLVHEGKQNDVCKPLFSFGLIADIQYAEREPNNSRYYRNSLSKFRDAVNHFNEMELEFVVSLGDYIDKNKESFDSVNVVAAGLNTQVIHVIGNHDFPYSESTYEKTLQAMQLEHSYYDFRIDSYRFIVLDGNDVSLHPYQEGDEEFAWANELLQELQEQEALNSRSWNGALGNRQMVWLEETLEKAQTNGEHVILFNHFPLYPPDQHNLWNNSEVMTLLEQYENTVAHFNGHNHGGNYEVEKGIHYLTLKGMVETPDSTAYAVIDVYPDRLELKGFGREISRTLVY